MKLKTVHFIDDQITYKINALLCLRNETLILEDLLSTQKSTDSDSMKLKDLAASYNYSDDEDLVNLDEFGDFEKAEKVVKRADSEVNYPL